MKKVILIVVLALLVFSFVTPVVASGGQVQGGTGNGKGTQETFEKGCDEQPCFSENADQPKYGPKP